MMFSSRDIILFAHSTFGVFGTLSAVWVFVEALNAREQNSERTRNAALIVTTCMVAAWILGGYSYVHLYAPDRAIILLGPWPTFHTTYMKTKEYLFFIALILSLYLPIAARDKLFVNAAARKMVLCVTLLIALSGLAVEGLGALVSHGAKLSFQRASEQGHEK